MTTKKTVVEQEMVPLEEAKEQVRRMCVRLALLHIAFARTIVDELGEKKGKKLILKAIKDYGIRIGQKAKEEALAQGLEPVPANFKGDLPMYGMHRRKGERVAVEGENRSRAFGCVMGELWRDLGEGELGRLYCFVDPAKYMAFNPSYKIYHVKAVPLGDEYCELVMRPTTEQERKDFAEKDADWEYIDK